jgi:hypothetical protein
LLDSLIGHLRSSKKTVLLIIIVAAITLVLSAIISVLLDRSNHLFIPSFGTIRTYGVKAYGGNITLREEEQCINWGTIYLGTSVNRSFYVQSRSNVEAILTFEFANWTFSDSNDENVAESFKNNMTVTTDCNVTIILPNEEMYVTLTLEAGSSPDFITDIIDKDVQKFSFEIIIYASEK